MAGSGFERAAGAGAAAGAASLLTGGRATAGALISTADQQNPASPTDFMFPVVRGNAGYPRYKQCLGFQPGP